MSVAAQSLPCQASVRSAIGFPLLCGASLEFLVRTTKSCLMQDLIHFRPSSLLPPFPVAVSPSSLLTHWPWQPVSHPIGRQAAEVWFRTAVTRYLLVKRSSGELAVLGGAGAKPPSSGHNNFTASTADVLVCGGALAPCMQAAGLCNLAVSYSDARGRMSLVFTYLILHFEVLLLEIPLPPGPWLALLAWPSERQKRSNRISRARLVPGPS